MATGNAKVSGNTASAPSGPSGACDNNGSVWPCEHWTVGFSVLLWDLENHVSTLQPGLVHTAWKNTVTSTGLLLITHLFLHIWTSLTTSQWHLVRMWFLRQTKKKMKIKIKCIHMHQLCWLSNVTVLSAGTVTMSSIVGLIVSQRWKHCSFQQNKVHSEFIMTSCPQYGSTEHATCSGWILYLLTITSDGRSMIKWKNIPSDLVRWSNPGTACKWGPR